MNPRDDAPDLVLRQGQIVTAFDNCVVEAMAVRANRVCAVGSNTYVSSLAGPRTQIVELGGRTVVPGINDSHVHIGFFGAVRPPLVLDVGFPAVRSIAEVAEVVRVAPRKNGWVKGIGWDVGYLDDAHPERSPRRDDLDPVSADTPVALRDFSGHQLWVNSKALELAGISENTPDPNDGLIVRDSDGRPTGILKESAATLVAQIMASDRFRTQSGLGYCSAHHARRRHHIGDRRGARSWWQHIRGRSSRRALPSAFGGASRKARLRPSHNCAAGIQPFDHFKPE